MNAKEAFRLAEQNERLKAENDFDEAITNMHERINKAALQGCVNTSIHFYPCNAWVKCEINKRIKDYFSELGYEIEIVNYVFDYSQTFKIRWDR